MANRKTLKRRLQRKRVKKNMNTVSIPAGNYVVSGSYSIPTVPSPLANHTMNAREYAAQMSYILDNMALKTKTKMSSLEASVPKKEEKKMGTYISLRNDVAAPLEIQQKMYLAERAREAFFAQERELPKTFGLSDDDRPQTPKELVERIQKGQFVLKVDSDDDPRDYYDTDELVYAFRWRDPAKVEDKDGYKTAAEALQKLFTETKDAVVIKSVDDGLAAIKALETAKFN